MGSTRMVALVWGSELPAVSIGFCDPMWPSDSGLSVITPMLLILRRFVAPTILGSVSCTSTVW